MAIPFVHTPTPPYYAVIFSSTRQSGDQAYRAMAERSVELAVRQPGFLGIGLDPAVDGARIDLDPPLGCDLLPVAVAQGAGQIPTNAKQDLRDRELPTFEGSRGVTSFIL
jgi:hypothetical protein